VLRLIQYLGSVDSPHAGAQNIDMLRKDFKQFFMQYDARRGKDFCETFPNLADWYNTL
jgi:hypothetical protein